MGSCCVTLVMHLNLSGYQVCPVYNKNNNIHLEVVSGVQIKGKKPERALERVTQGWAARSFLGLRIPLQIAPPAVGEDIRAQKRESVHRPWAQPTPQENPSALQPWESGILHPVVSMEKIPVPAILQPI